LFTIHRLRHEDTMMGRRDGDFMEQSWLAAYTEELKALKLRVANIFRGSM
jgi:hypothetical protein